MTPKEVAEVMGEVLDDGNVGLDDNFFEIGGNSFMLLQVAARVEERAGVRLRIIDVVRAATPHDLATLIDARMHADEAAGR